MSPPANSMMPRSLDVFTGPVFHYTSAAGLLAIIESRRLRASSAASLNDLGEVRQGWALIQKILLELPRSDAVDLLERMASDPLRKEHEVFVLSGSTQGDDANQWRLYADRGRGYVIELDGAVTMAAVSDVLNLSNSVSTPAMGILAKDAVEVSPWHHVLYEEPDVRHAVMDLLRSVEGEDQRIAATTGMTDDQRDFEYESLQSSAYDVLSRLAHLIKMPGFSGENEVRVVTTFAWGSEHVRYRAGTDGIVGFATLTATTGGPAHRVLRPSAGGVPLAGALPAKSVRLGPLLRPEHAGAILAFMRKSGLRDVAVMTSAVPLR